MIAIQDHPQRRCRRLLLQLVPLHLCNLYVRVMLSCVQTRRVS